MHLRFLMVLSWITPALLIGAESPTMYPCSIELPGHVLKIALPEGNVRSLPPKTIRQVAAEGIRLSSADSFLQEAEFKSILEWLYDFHSSFRVEAIGSLKLTVLVRRRSLEYRGQIDTPENLYHYLCQQISPKYGFFYERTAINGVECVRRFRNTFGNIATKENGEELEIFSFPLNQRLFLDVGFNVMEWVPGRTKSWKELALKLREKIKSTIVLDAGP